MVVSLLDFTNKVGYLLRFLLGNFYYSGGRRASQGFDGNMNRQ